MKRNTSYMFFLLLLGLVGMALRFWNLSAAYDARQLPVSHISTWLLAGFLLLSATGILILSLRSPGRSRKYCVLHSSVRSAGCAVVGGGLIVLSGLLELLQGITTVNLVFCIAAAVCGICLVLAALARRNDTASPAAEVIPVIYLVLRLIFNFKSWSTDPIILDYCIKLFALILTLLAVYCSAGFAFDLGKPRKTLFYASCALVFSLSVMADAIAEADWSLTVFYPGILLWLAPMIPCLMAPAAPDPAPTDKE